jgi:hypothetical protein
MNKRIVLSIVVIAAVQGALGSAVAGDLSATPVAQTQDGITYLSGGIGEGETTAMKEAASDYTLMLTFATKPTGSYLADVVVSIKDKSGSPVLESLTSGPILLVRLAPGQYRISAVSNGGTVDQTVDIGSEHPLRVTLSWPEQPGQAEQKETGL